MHMLMVQESTHSSNVDNILGNLEKSLLQINHEYRNVRLPSMLPSKESPSASVPLPYSSPPQLRTAEGHKEGRRCQ